jgi:transposase InsO family protein
LGYPSRKRLTQWYKEYQESGGLLKKFSGKYKYSDEFEPEKRITRRKQNGMIQFSQEQKKEEVIQRNESVATVVNRASIDKQTLEAWKKVLFSEENAKSMDRSKRPDLPDDRDVLLAELESLKEKIYWQRMELDVLVKTAEIIKKGKGIDPRKLENNEKTRLIDALRNEYLLKDLLKIIEMPKSSYFYQEVAQQKPDKYTDLRTEVNKVFFENKSCYGYRRVHAAIKGNGVIISEKVIQMIMRQEQLVVTVKRRRKYNSYKGEISPAAENVVARDFHADSPNTKWLTDLTEFHIPAGKVYLSPIVDCFDGLAVSWTLGTNPDSELVNTMLDGAIRTLATGEHPIVHSDRGFHYRWPSWISRMKNAGLTRSMSRKGCSPDNSACEGFFGRLKNEMFYNRSWRNVSIDNFISELDSYLKWYNEKRIKMSLGGMSPIAYRRSIGLAV